MIETVILSHLLFNEDYCRKVIPFIRKEYFSDAGQRLTFEMISAFVSEYNKLPTREILMVELVENERGIDNAAEESALEIIKELTIDDSDVKWLINTTETFCQKRALHNAILEAVGLYEDDKAEKGSIPKLLQDALAVGFDSQIGHNFFEDAEARFESYSRKERKIPFRQKILNDITNGGVEFGTLNCLLGGIYAGKSRTMCSFASDYLLDGVDVVYITLEMSEEKVSERIDCNLLNVPLDELAATPKDMYMKKVAKVRGMTPGNLVVKQFPTGSANVNHIRHFINELRLKKSFMPKVIFVDYINLMSSSRIKPGRGENSYTIVKAIAEELRGLAIELGVAIWTATQLNREGFSSSDPDMDATSESFGLPATLDLYWALVVSEEMKAKSQTMFKQLKNRYRDVGFLPKFVMNIMASFMRVVQPEDDQDMMWSEDKNKPDHKAADDMPFFDKTTFGAADTERKKARYDSFV